MTEKSHVGLAQHVCPVCTKEHDPVVLLDKRLKNTLTNHEFAGWSLCPEHQKMADEGYIALVECANPDAPTLETAKRTGTLGHVRTEVWGKLFNIPPPKTKMAFIEVGVLDRLQAMQTESEATDVPK